MNFSYQVKEYQRALVNNTHSQTIEQAVRKLTNIDLTLEQLTYLTCLFNIRNNYHREGKYIDTLELPVQYLFSLMTPFPSKDYSKNVSQEYMALITTNCIEPLSSLVTVSDYDKTRCRKFTIDSLLISQLDTHIEDVLEHTVPLESLKHNTTLGIKPAKWGGYCLNISHLPTLTKNVWHKLKNSQFRFDVDLFNSPEGKAFNRSLNMNKHQRSSLIHALSGMLTIDTPQYHNSFFIQGSGRLHTNGGPMNLNALFRRHYIKPVNPLNHTLEVDLKCAQLLALCDLLGASQVKYEISTITKKESIWKYIGSPDIPKELKKVIVYGFCFGAKVSDLPYLATYRGNVKHNLNHSITKEDVEDCFSGILQPLIILRDKWMSKYSIPNITSGNVDKVIHTNALGLKFNLNKEVLAYKKEVKKHHMDSLKVAARLLAFYSQASEQLVIQSLLSQDFITNNILTYSYDGFTLETPNPEFLLSQAHSYLNTSFPLWNLDSNIYC